MPLGELLDERDKRQRLERELQQYRQNEPKPKGFDPESMFSDPQGFYQHIEQQFAQRVALAELNADLRMTAIQHGEEWPKAWDAYIRHVSEKDEAGQGKHAVDYYRVMNSASPGQEIVRWFREQSWREQIGDDPQSYQDKLLDDPEFLAKVASRLGLAAPAVETTSDRLRGSDGRFRPTETRPQTRLPTSLSKASGSGTHGDDAPVDGSEGSIWKAGAGRRRR